MSEVLINSILREYEVLRGNAVKERDKRVKAVYEANPEIEETEKKINECGIKYTSEIIKNPLKGKEILAEMEKNISELKLKRKKLLEENKIDFNYNKVKYNCEKCSDTGFIENKKCECLKKRLRKHEYEMSNIGNLIKTHNFESFDFSYYSDKKNKSGISPKEYIQLAYNNSKKMCEDFENSKNIMFYGNSGLGKTFLSCCVAKEIIDLGYDVRFFSAVKLFSIYDEYKFNKGDFEENKRKIDEIYNCDLLIIDNLGTEFFTQNSLSFFLDILNERIIKNKKIIITTNLSIEELDKKYTPRFVSHLYESFNPMRIEGQNIRKILL